MKTKTKSFSRDDWLSAKGFSKDPFLPSSFRAETDNLFDLPGFPTYIDKMDTKLIIGDFDNPGYHFIFSQPGGGKSSLRRRIHFEYELRETTPNVLVVDYLDHNYPLTETQVSDHIDRIIHLIEAKLNKDLSSEKALITKSPVLALKKVIKDCKKSGFIGVYILVDDLNLQTFQKVLALAENVQYFNIDGLVLKYFLPENLLLFAQSVLPFSKFPPYVLSWDQNELAGVINQRLITCLDPDYLVTPNVKPISFLFEEYQNLSVSVQDTFIKLGELAGSPRLMWQFGNCLLEEHINDDKSHLVSDLINQETYARARLRLFDDLLKNGMVFSYTSRMDLDFEYRQRVKVPTGHKPNAKIYLCYPEKDEKLVYEGLYQELQIKNYQPWMRRDAFAGEDREAAIQSAIEKCDFFLLCLSPRSANERGYFQKEKKWAMDIQNGLKEDDIFIIPVRLEKCRLPDHLKQWHVDWFIEEQKAKLFAALEEGKTRRRGKK